MKLNRKIILEMDSDEAVLSDSYTDSSHDEDSVTTGCVNNASGSKVDVFSGP